ncbi:SOS response regulatory protein OraA/RecX, interacts with RecA [Lysobacter sp. yr284]|nr:SOS response regulatory protein OraA/RecX, interacts with RecA [Lysobacter sp. yr284]
MSLNDLRARMRAIESGSRSADADRPSRESSFSDTDTDTDTGSGSGSGSDPQAESPARPDVQVPSVTDAAARGHPGLFEAAPCRPGDRGAPNDRRVAADPSAAAAEPTPAEDAADPAAGLFPAHSTSESTFEHPFADGDGHLFDQSTSGPSRRERRRASREQTPAQRALGLLVRREHSRKELTRKLTSRGLDREQVVEAVDRLADAGWQDDARFAETLVRSRANNGYGPVHIRAELGTHGLDGEAIAVAMAAFEGDWLENARNLLRRRFGEAYAQDPARRRKAADLLMRRGFDMETIRIASRSYVSD